MLAISIRCTNPDCRKTLRAKDDFAGKRVKCPACGHSIAVSAQQIASPSAGIASKPRTASTRQPGADHSTIAQTRRARWPWFAGAAVLILVLGVGLALSLNILGRQQSAQNSATVEKAAGLQQNPKPEPKPESKPEPMPEPQPEAEPKLPPVSKFKDFEWQTTERLVLDAPEAKQAKNGRVWISSDGKRTAYIRQQDKKECLVVDGTPGKLYDEVRVGYRQTIFFAGDKHYGYVAIDGKQHCVVVDGNEDQKYELVTTGNHYFLHPIDKSWTYLAYKKGFDRWLVIDGKEVYKVPIIAQTGELLYSGSHLLTWDFESSKDVKDARYFAFYDGKRGKGYGYLQVKSLTLHPAGAYGYLASDKIGEGYYCVINGKESTKYQHIIEGSITFSPDGRHHAFAAIKKIDDFVVVVDGQEHSVPGHPFKLNPSPDGKHWGCVALKDSQYSVVLDGKVVASGIKSVDFILISPVSGHLAYKAWNDQFSMAFVVFDGTKHASYNAVSNLVFSPDGRRLAYMAKRAQDNKYTRPFVVVEAKEGKEYDRIRGGTINFGLDGRSLSYIVNVGKDGDEGFLVIDGHERTKYHKIGPTPTEILYYDLDSLAYVAVRDGAYYWVEERRVKK